MVLKINLYYVNFDTTLRTLKNVNADCLLSTESFVCALNILDRVKIWY